MSEHQYRGRIRTVRNTYQGIATYGYIDQTTTVPLEGSPELGGPENEGVFLHAEDCDRPLRVGMEVAFSVVPDTRRDDGSSRAVFAHETPDSRLRGMAEGGVSLGTSTRELQDATFFTTWCLDAAAADRIKQTMFEKKVLRLLLVQYRVTGNEASPTSNEKRKLVRLNDPLTALSFNASGRHRVVAVVISGESESDLRDGYLQVRNGRYTTSVLAYRGDCLSSTMSGFSLASGCFDVDIPTELFAPEPFDYAWVNSFFRESPKDECAFRRRRLLVYPYQVIRLPLVCLFALFKSVIACAAIAALFAVGMRGIGYRTLRHPHRTPIGYVWANLQGSRFVITDQGRHDLSRFMFSPAALSVALIVALIFAGGASGASKASGHFLTVLGGLVVLTSAVILVSAAVFRWAEGVSWEGKFLSFMDDWKSSRTRRRRERADAKDEARYQRRRRNEELAEQQRRTEYERIEREARELICATTGPRVPDVRQLPFRPKTIRFYLVAWKLNVCKNFSAT